MDNPETEATLRTRHETKTKINKINKQTNKQKQTNKKQTKHTS
jgi:hypothetical protein